MYARPTANTAWPLSISHRIVRSTAYVVRLARGYIAYRNRYVAIERGERFGSDGEGDSDRGDPRGLNESARPRVLHLSPFSVSLFHPSSTRFAFLVSIPRPLLLEISSSRHTEEYRIERDHDVYPPSFSHDGSSTMETERNVKLGRSKESPRGLSRSGTRKGADRRRDRVAWGKGRVYFNGIGRGEPHAKMDVGQDEERGKRSCL